MKILKSKQKKDKKTKSGWGEVIKTALIVLVIVLVVAGILWKTNMIETFKIARQIQQQQQLSVEDVEILAQLKQIILLPDDVTPTMALVTDAEALKETQPMFFANVADGQRLILYPEQAILFDAVANKIIKVGPVAFGQADIGTVPFALYNGTNDNNSLTKFEEKLKTTINNAEVKVKENAVGFYQETLVIDLVGDNPEINKIAESLGGKVAQLPEGETAPEGAVILIIVGVNQ